IPFVRILIPFFLFSLAPYFLNAQATCLSPFTLNPSTNCVNTTGNLQDAVNSAPTGSCGGATSTTTNGIWFSFTATTTSAFIDGSISNPTVLTAASTYIEVFSGTCGSLTPIACGTMSSTINLSALNIGSVYLIRVYITGSTTSGGQTNRRRFNIC